MAEGIHSHHATLQKLTVVSAPFFKKIYAEEKMPSESRKSTRLR